MTLRQSLPILMGALMGLMLLWMAHGVMTGNDAVATPALLIFLALHLAVIAVFFFAALWATRFAPGLKKWIDRMHRPSRKHIGQMTGAAFAAAALAHIIVHGGL